MDIAILIYDGFTALDAVGPYEVLSCLPKVKVHFIAKDVGLIRTHTRALSLMADFKLSDLLFHIRILSLSLWELRVQWSHLRTKVF